MGLGQDRCFEEPGLHPGGDGSIPRVWGQSSEEGSAHWAGTQGSPSEPLRDLAANGEPSPNTGDPRLALPWLLHPLPACVWLQPGGVGRWGIVGACLRQVTAWSLGAAQALALLVGPTLPWCHSGSAQGGSAPRPLPACPAPHSHGSGRWAGTGSNVFPSAVGQRPSQAAPAQYWLLPCTGSSWLGDTRCGVPQGWLRPWLQGEPVCGRLWGRWVAVSAWLLMGQASIGTDWPGAGWAMEPEGARQG